jgi:scaffold protein (connect acetoacetyl-CoA thiolase and HMG-CoA synthase)
MPAPRYAREIPQRYRFEATRCQNCRKVAFPPRQVCPGCRGEALEAVVLSDEGTLATWTVIHVAPRGFAMQTPYVVGIIELPEGVRVTAQVVDADPSELDFGTRVRRVLRRLSEEDEGGIIHYGYKFVLAR